MPYVNHAVNNCSPLRTTSGASHWRKKNFAVITQDRLIDNNLKQQIKNRTFYTS